MELFDTMGGSHGQWVMPSTIGGVDDPAFAETLGSDIHKALKDDIELLDMAGDKFDLKKVLKGELTPMFFGSAMTNFGVRPFLEEFLKLAPQPARHNFIEGCIEPNSESFSAFVFKIQANMNPAHRDRIAFIRICSGKFTRGMTVRHVQSGKPIKLAQPQQFLAQDRVIIDEAYPGDIVGLFDSGIFGIGDTLCQEGQSLQFQDFPVFPPERFARVQPKDTMKRKQFNKGIMQLTQEGAIQVFEQKDIGVESFIVGTVGVLQFEVLEYRLKNEYGVDLEMNYLPYNLARWLEGNVDLRTIKGMNDGMIIYDRKGRPVALFTNEWSLRWVSEKNPKIRFLEVPSDSHTIG
jgi:peptide chain release factor 3